MATNGIRDKALLPPRAKTWLDTLSALEGESGISFAPNMDAVRQREADLAAYLGQTDYDKQLQESRNMAKLQLGLALAQRGFGSMGAQPRPGEMAISTVGRELLSPLSGDALTVAQQMNQQKLATQQAKRQEERQIKLAALQAVTGEEAGLRSLATELTPTETDKGLSTLQANVNVPVTYKNKQGETVTETIPGNVNVYRSKLGDVSQIRTVGDLITSDSTVIASGTVVPGFSKIPTEEEKGQFEGLKFVVRRKEDGTGWEFPNAANIVQVRQEKDIDQPIDVRTLEPYALQEGEAMFAFSDLPDYLKGTVSDKDTYKSHLVVVDNKTKLALLDDQNRRVEVTLGPDNKPYVIGTNQPYIQPPNTSFMSLADYDAPDPAVTQEGINRTARIDTVLSEMSRLQAQQRGEGRTYSARSGLYWDQSRYANGEFPFMYASDPDDPTTYTPIEDPKIQALINNKVNAIASTMLKSNFGEQTAEVKSARIAQAVRSILEPTAYTWFGGQEIPDIGYVPVDPTRATASNRANAKDVMTTLFDDPDGTVDAGLAFSVIPYAPNAEDLSRNPFRLRVASYHFPDAFGAPRTTATGTLEEWQTNYDPGQVQERADIEAGIKNARILPDATRADHRAAIQDAAGKIATARNTEQTKPAAGLAEDEVRMRLEFRRALLAFRNAAAETGVEGFVTGPLAASFSKIGLADWIVGEGSLHWDRLTQASDRLTEGQSRRIGKDFGDDRISNYDAQAYKNLVADIKRGGAYNKILVEDGLALINRELDGLMQLGGKVGYSERLLQEVAQAGVDFSKLKTQLNWHGHGFYGGNRYSSSRQRTPSLSIDNRNHIRRSGELLDSMYDNKYIVPIVGYDGNPPQFDAKTKISPMGPSEFNTWVTDRAKTLGISYQEMFNRAVEGILSYNIFRETMGGE